MAKQCAVCNRLFHNELDACPRCAGLACEQAPPAPRIRTDSADERAGWFRLPRAKAAKQQNAVEVVTVGDSWQVNWQSGREPLDAALNPMDGANSTDAQGDSSPLLPAPKAETSRIDIHEAEIDSETAPAPGNGAAASLEPPAADGKAAPGAPGPGSDSEFDLRLMCGDEEGPPPDRSQWQGNGSSTPHRSGSDDFGPELCDQEDGGEMAESNFEINLEPTALASGKSTHGEDSISEVNTDDPENGTSDSGTKEVTNGQAAAASAQHPPAGDPPADLDHHVPAQPGALRGDLDLAVSDGELDMNLVQAAFGAVSVPESEPVKGPAQFLISGNPPHAPETHHLHYALLGVLIGAAACFALWLLGLQPPSAWRLRHSPEYDKTVADLESQIAGLEADRLRPSTPRVKTEAEEWTAQRSTELHKAIDLAKKQQYPAALDTLRRLCSTQEKHARPAALAGPPSPSDEADTAFLTTCHELLDALGVQEKLAKEGLLSQQDNPSVAVQKLLADSKALKETVDGVGAALKSAPGTGGSGGLAADVERVVKAQAAAEKQATEAAEKATALLSAERERAAQATKAAETASARATELQEKLKIAEEDLQRTKIALREAGVKKEVVDQAKPAVLPPLKVGKTSGGAAAYEHYTKGLRAYRDGNYQDAEKEFQEAVENDQQDARYYYYLGLARWSLGKKEVAADDFRAGAKLEKENKPSHIFIQLALDGAEEEALRDLGRFRP